eukprot:jgi/Mesen1/6481/ME000331S05600
MSKVDGQFLFSPVSVNLLTELCKMVFAICMLIFQARKQRPGEKSLLSLPVIMRAARANILLAVPSFLYAINNYLKFIMQLYFKPATAKMLTNLKVLTIALLLKVVMRRKFSTMQWEALCLLLIGISVNQMPCGQSSSALAPLSSIVWVYVFLSVTIPSAASVYNEYALKSQFDTSVHLQNLFMFGYGAFFNLIFYVFMQAVKDTILKKYSSTIATIFTGLASAALFGHALTINFVLGVSVVLISMHQFFSSVAQPARSEQQQPQQSRHGPTEGPNGTLEHHLYHHPPGNMLSPMKKDTSLLEMTAGASEEVRVFLRTGWCL